VAALGISLAAPAATVNRGQPQSYPMQIRLIDRYHAGEYAGVLSLTIYPDGIVQGLTARTTAGRPW
jgi:hypothetical protein